MKQVYYKKVCKDLAIFSGVKVEILFADEYLYNFKTKTIQIERIGSCDTYTHIQLKMDDLFMQSLLAKTHADSCIKTIPMPLLSFLHELGHAHTATLQSLKEHDMEIETSRKYVEEIDPPMEERMNIYFNLFLEVKASKWAVEFAEKNFDYITTLWNKNESR